jgi:putative ABC transport system permease protein
MAADGAATPAWGAVRAIARVELRRRWRSLVVLGVLAGLVAAVAIGALSMARRSATAHERLEAVTHIDDARIAMYGGLDPAAVETLPQVASAWTSQGAVGQLMGKGVVYAAISSGPPPPPNLFVPVVMDGRRPHPDAADEALISEPMADELGIAVGDVLPLKLLTQEEFGMWDVGFGEPDGPLVQLRVTGIARMSMWGSGMGNLLAPPAFAQTYADYLTAAATLVRLQPGSTGAELSAALDALAAQVPPPPGAPEGTPGAFYDLSLPATQDDATVATTVRVLVGGLVALAGVVTLAGLLALGQALGRHHAAAARDQQDESALGIARAERVLARVLPATVGAALAVVVAAAGGLAAGRLEPLGALRRFEPHPGWAPNLALVACGALIVGAAFLALAAFTAARAGRTDSSRRSRAGLAPRAATAFGRRPALLAATYLAFSRGRGRSAVPVRTTHVGAVLGVAGIVASLTFAASMERLGAEPARFGWQGHLGVVDIKDDEAASLAADPRVAGLTVVDEGTVRIGSEFAATMAPTAEHGRLGWTLLEGRAPTRPDEVAIGPRLARTVGVEVGEAVTARAPDGSPRQLEVVGLVLTPPSGYGRFGTSAVMHAETFRELNGATAYRTGYLRAVDDATGAALYDELASRLEVVPATPPPEVRNLLDLGRLPAVLAAFLAALAAAVLGHAVVLTVARRGSDMAVLRAVGLARRQVASAVVLAAAATALVGLLIGVPLGLAVARLVWGEVAASSGLAGDVLVPAGSLALAAGAGVAGAALLAVLPAVRAARLAPAEQLRAE